MGKLGRWLDGLDDEQKDRLVRAQGWVKGNWVTRGEPHRCLVGHLLGAYAEPGPVVEVVFDHTEMQLQDLLDSPDSVEPSLRLPDGGYVWGRFDDLCERFGVARVSRAIKKRCGASVEAMGETSDSSKEDVCSGA